MPPVYLFKCKNLSDLIKPDQKIALFLDFDGTLVPIQKDPAQCFLTPEIKRQLRLLASADHCYVSILSGRKLSDIRKRIGIPGIYYGGNHGIDISGPNLRYTHPKAILTRAVLLNVKRLLRKEITDIEGAWLEDKRFTLTLHFRTVKKGAIPFLKKTFYKTVAGFVIPPYPPLVKGGWGDYKRDGKERYSNKKPPLTVIKGKKVLELTPNILWDKGKAALWILQRLKDKCLPVYVGDDQTDETAFKALRKKGITIHVGKSKKTLADYYLKGYWEISRLLKQMQEIIKTL